MSRLIDLGAGTPIGIDECGDLLMERHVNPDDEEGFAELAPIIARLARNREFLGDAAIAALKSGGDNAGYGAQVLALDLPGNRYPLRAGFWPASHDAAYLESGPAAFCYGVAHDHDFRFLTCGYFGPGYLSEEWEVDPDSGALVAKDRSRLEVGQVRLYRAYRDVHMQLPPERFSISLNLIDRARPSGWRPQSRYDPATGHAVQALAADPHELLLEIVARIGSENGLDLITEMAAKHADERSWLAPIRNGFG